MATHTPLLIVQAEVELGTPTGVGCPAVFTDVRLGSEFRRAETSSSARCLSEVSSNERCTWLVRLVYRRP